MKEFFNVEFPFNVKIMEIFYQILLPLYNFSIFLQRQDSVIAEIVPSLVLTIYAEFKKMQIEDENAKLFLESLVKHILKKFKYELNSPIYHSAAILNVSRLNGWMFRSFSSSLSLKKHLTLYHKLLNHSINAKALKIH